MRYRTEGMHEKNQKFLFVRALLSQTDGCFLLDSISQISRRHGYDLSISGLQIFERCGCHARVRVLNGRKQLTPRRLTLTDEPVPFFAAYISLSLKFP